MEQEIEIEVLVAGPEHEKYVDTILETIAEAAKVRGTGIAKRTHEYLAKKMMEAKAVIALTKDGTFAGFSYIETWENQQYVTTSGLIVHPDFRGHHVAKRIKDMTFTLARTRWPHAKIFSLTSGAAVMAMNTALGYQPVTFADLTEDEAFWKGCEGCCNPWRRCSRNRRSLAVSSDEQSFPGNRCRARLTCAAPADRRDCLSLLLKWRPRQFQTDRSSRPLRRDVSSQTRPWGCGRCCRDR